MAISRFNILPLAFIFTLLYAEVSFCADSPSPAPAIPADTPSSPSPSPSADISSPPAPPPSSNPSPSSSPTPPPSPTNTTSNSPTPTPTSPASSPAPGVNGISHAGVADDEAKPEPSSTGGGMSAGKKAGTVIGVFACVGFVVFVGMLYKKRQHNIRRSQYSSAARREFLSDL